jgi:hypothetical protein
MVTIYKDDKINEDKRWAEHVVACMGETRKAYNRHFNQKT